MNKTLKTRSLTSPNFDYQTAGKVLDRRDDTENGELYFDHFNFGVNRRDNTPYGVDQIQVSQQKRQPEPVISMASWGGTIEETETLIKSLQKAVRLAKQEAAKVA